MGSLMFYGRGAGGMPTASAVLGDVIDAAVNLSKGTHGSLGTFGRAVMRPIDETSTEYLLSLEVADRPGVLHAVTGVFARHGVSIRAAEQEGNAPDARAGVHHPRGQGVVGAGHAARAARTGRRAQRRRAAAGDRAMSARYVSTRGAAPELGFCRGAAGGAGHRWRLVRARSLAVAADRWCRGATYAERAAQVIGQFVGDDIASRRAAGPVPAGVRHVRPSCGRAAGPDRRRPLRARAVPRPDAGVQGRRPAVGRPAVRPRAGRNRADG